MPRVKPTITPRACSSQYGAPRPVKAGTRYTPPVSGTCRAAASLSEASAIRPRPSRSHWIVAPATNTLPSSAYSTRPSIPQAIVVTRPDCDAAGFVPVFISRKQPVP